MISPKRCLVPVLALVLAACGGETSTPDPTPTSGIDFEVVGDVFDERMDVQAGERVLLVGLPGRFDPMLPVLQERIEARGGEYLGAVSVSGSPFPAPHSTDFTNSVDGMDIEGMEAAFADVDLGIMLPGATVTHAPYKAMQNLLYDGTGRTIHFHWAGAYRLDGTLFEPDDHVDQFYVSSLANTDYAALAQSQQAFETALRDGQVRVTTPAGTDITFRVGDRPVTKQDGDASAVRATSARNLIDLEVELPAGAVRVAPLEETVEGTIVFPPSVWGGEEATGVTLTFVQGRATSVTADQGVAGVERELEEAGDAGRAFRELALGFNPTLAIPADRSWIPYYGYGAGVVRLSLGDNSELGGAVGGGYVRWNFFTDATVTVGDDVWVRDGVLIQP